MHSLQLELYLKQFMPDRPELIRRMEQYAALHNIPIMDLEGMEIMLQFLRIQRPKMILEVGTAIGYSALRMSYTIPDATIVSIEKDGERLQAAKAFIQESGRKEHICLIEGDALKAVERVKPFAPYDCIFIDAAKGQNKHFFEMYTTFLGDNGIVITDNVLFKGLVYEKEIRNRRTRSLIKRINEYNRWIMNHPDFDSIILPVGDGIAVSKKR